MVASYYGATEIVKLLLARGAKVDLQDRYGTTAMHRAVLFDRLAVVRILLHAHASLGVINQGGKTVLRLAQEFDKVECQQLFREHLEMLARQHQIRRSADSAVLYAAMQGDTPTVAAWLDAGGDINAFGSVKELRSSGEEASTETTLLIAACDYGRMETVELLIKRGANLNQKDRFSGFTALMGAVANNCPAAVRCLLLADADTSVRQKIGMDALDVAKKYNRVECTNILTEHKASLERARVEANRAMVSARNKASVYVAPRRGSPPDSTPDSPPDSDNGTGAGCINKSALNCHHEAETARHKAESAERRKVREAAVAAKANKKAPAFTKPGPSGPARVGRAAEEDPGLSAREKERGQKAEAVEAHKAAIAARREAERKLFAEQAADQARRDLALEIGDQLGR